MNKKLFLHIVLACLLWTACTGSTPDFKLKANEQPFTNPQTEALVNALYDRMTPEERIAQLLSMYVADLFDEDGKLDPAKCQELIPNGIGHFAQYASNCAPEMSPNQIRDMVAQAQDWIIHNTPSGVPALFHEEVLSGIAAPGATTYPQQIGLACSFNTNLNEAKTRQTAAAMRKIGGYLSLSPMVDVSRNPYFNRNEESFGEDSYLSAAMGVSFVQGLQEGGLENGVAACSKHFLGYGSGYLSEDKEMMEEILLPHEAMIRTAGSKVVMTGYHAFHGTNCVANPELGIGILKTYLGYDGVMVSDYTSVNQFPLPEGANSSAHRAAAALNAGNDVEFQTPVHYPHLPEAVTMGLVDSAALEASIKRVLTLKARLGMLGPNAKLYETEDITFDTPEERETAYQLATQSVVLLKNNGILPLKGEAQKIALTGPNANQMWAMLGDYTYQAMVYFWHHMNPNAVTPKIVLLKEAMDAKLPQGWSMAYERGCDWTQKIETKIPDAGDPRARMMWYRNSRRVESGEEADWDNAIAIASQSDVIVAAMGENVLLCGENRDRGGLGLPGKQQEFVEALIATGKPVVLLMFGGRAQVIGDLADKCAAVIQAWYPGEEGGNAVADILYGNVSPSGKLSVSYPNVELNENICYNYSLTQDPRIQYPFGYGLSYTTFDYANLQVDRSVKTTANAFNIRFDLTNSGSVDADEIVQIYLSPTSSEQPLKPIQLQGFGRVSLKAGETASLHFIMSPQQLGYYADGHWNIAPGDYQIKVAASSQDIRLQQTVTLKGNEVEMPLRSVYFSEMQ